MPLDPKLTKYSTASPVVASFDFADIASGINFVSFYPTVTNETGGIEYLLVTDSNIYSVLIESSQTNTGTTTLTFDSFPFNLTRTVKGTAFANIGRQASTTGSNETHTVQIKKWDGSSATNISSEVTTICGLTATVSANQLPCTETIIAEGEQLRIVIKLTVVGASEKMTMGHDPKNRDGTILTPSSEDTITASVIHIPFKVE